MKPADECFPGVQIVPWPEIGKMIEDTVGKEEIDRMIDLWYSDAPFLLADAYPIPDPFIRRRKP